MTIAVYRCHACTLEKVDCVNSTTVQTVDPRLMVDTVELVSGLALGFSVRYIQQVCEESTEHIVWELHPTGEVSVGGQRNGGGEVWLIGVLPRGLVQVESELVTWKQGRRQTDTAWQQIICAY